jgi:hypothetical protein
MLNGLFECCKDCDLNVLLDLTPEAQYRVEL